MATLNQIVTEIADTLNRPHDTLFKERLKLVIKHERSTLIRQSLNKYNDATLFKQRYTVPVTLKSVQDCIVTDIVEALNSTSGAGTPLISISSTGSFTVGDSVWITSTAFPTGEVGTILSISTNTALLLTANLVNSYTVAASGKVYIAQAQSKRTTNKILKPIRYNTDVPFNFVGNSTGTKSYIYSNIEELAYTSTLTLNASVPRYTYRNGYIYVYATDSVLSTISTISIDAPFEVPEGVIPSETNDDYIAGVIYNDDMEFPMPDDLVQDIKARIFSGELRITDAKDKVEATHLDNE